VLLVDGVCMLVNIVITEPTSWAIIFCGVVAIIVVQTKDGFSCD
jgi:hypothetical protein